MNAMSFLSPTERTAVETAVAEVERRTAAEMVCALATESGRYDRAESLVGLAGSLVGLSLAHVTATGSAQWGGVPIDLGWQALSVVLGFVVGSFLASYVHPLRALFVSRREMAEETLRAAEAVFARRRLSSTRKHAGLLVYVSLFERRAVVLADQGALAVLGQNGIEGIRDAAILMLRAGRRRETFTAALELAAERLAHALPPDPRNPNELPNRLLIFHPRP